MLVIRLSRTGRKKQPYYRVVVADKRAAVQGQAIEVLGHFNPRTKELEIDVERAKARLQDGAQPSETAEALLEKAGVLKRSAITEQNRRPERKKRKEIKAEAAEDSVAPAAAAKAATAAPAAADDAKSADARSDDAAKDEPKQEAKAENKTDNKKDSSKEAKGDST